MNNTYLIVLHVSPGSVLATDSAFCPSLEYFGSLFRRVQRQVVLLLVEGQAKGRYQAGEGYPRAGPGLDEMQ